MSRDDKGLPNCEDEEVAVAETKNLINGNVDQV
jgi:hypothetical protein